MGLSAQGLVDGAASSAGMLWERLFLLVHAELGLSLLLCASDTLSWAVTDTSRDVDLCQRKHKQRKLSAVFQARSHAQMHLFVPLTAEGRGRRRGTCEVETTLSATRGRAHTQTQ